MSTHEAERGMEAAFSTEAMCRRDERQGLPAEGPSAPSAERKRHSYAVEQRLRLIDFLLANYGTLNRSALEDYFGVSTPQASADIQEYLRMAPDNLVYDHSAKTYRRTDKFARKYA